MVDIEIFLKEKLSPIHTTWYFFWVYWWPLWRKIYSGRNIQKKWQSFGVIKEGQSFLDYGCGPGVFTIPAAKIVGEGGQVYALDCILRHLKITIKKAKKAGLSNIKTILSDGKTGLPKESIDVIWMCDVFHEIKQKHVVLKELYKVLREDGNLFIYDGMRCRVLSYTMDLFSLVDQDGKFLKFAKIS